MKNHTDLNLGESLSILTSFNFSESGIYRFVFIFDGVTVKKKNVLVECIWSEIRQTRENRTSAQREFDLKSRAWFQTKIARHEVQLPLNYSHFKISKLSECQYLIDPVGG